MARNEQKKEAALAALMESNTLTEAAERAGICRKTLYTYIREDHSFALAYQSLQEQTVIRAMESAEQRSEHASEVIMSIMDDETQPGAIRLKAAQMILEQNAKQSEKVCQFASDNVDSTKPLFSF